MPLSPGTKIGAYEVIAIIGAGGMGEVYRARDAKLNRDVALKVLPESVAVDPDRLARFRREAQVLAALNHPNIAHVHGFEDSPSAGAGPGATIHALVMELVEGPTLADRMAPGPMPVTDALPIAKQIADAMEAAHDQGIVHRDLKPANIKVKEDGTVKVLDFGLAKAMSSDPSGLSGGDAMNSPTLTARSTQLGVILGTAAYMSPEQAKGRQVDRRADIWAFGVILFEMLAGRRGYEAEDISETLAAVLTREVDWSQLPPGTPTRLTALIKDCLVRDPKDRLRDIGEARRELQRMIEGKVDTAAPATKTVATPAWQRIVPWALAAIALLVAAASFALNRPAQAARPGNVVRAAVPYKDFSALLSISNDGTKAAYNVAGGPNSAYLALRMLDQFDGKPIPGSDGGAWAVFSPAGDWIAYSTLSGNKISKIPLTGGTSIFLCEGTFLNGASWGADDQIVFSGAKGLMQVGAGGGTPASLTTVDGAKGEGAHVRPQHLPGGKQVLFTIQMKDASQPVQFAVLDLASKSHKTVARGGLNGRYLTSGHLAYVRGGTLFAVPFDLQTLTVVGSEVPVVERISTQGPNGTADYAVSEDGTLVYFAAATNDGGTTLAWLDRGGRTTVLPGQSTRAWGTGRLSPNGRFVANGISNSNGGRDIWIFDVDRGTPTRVTFGEYNDFPVWTSDSKRIYFGATVNGKNGIYRAPADGSGKPELVVETPGQPTMESVLANEKTLVFTMAGKDQPPKIMVLDLTNGAAAGAPRALHETTVGELTPQVSPDGKWIAYASTESGALEIYLHAFPTPGAKVRVSTDGGQRPRWSRDGKELFYLAGAPTTRVMSVAIPADDALRPGAPVQVTQQLVGTTFDVTPDKDKFLIELTTSGEGTRFAIVTNWLEEVKRRVPVKK